jgi:D-glycero-alpha-D-manno-heptose-7-phosphate kinase
VSNAPVPVRFVNAAAPIRICDNGGWTDTWFAGRGNVFNVAVSPNVEVQIAVHPVGALADRIVLNAESLGDCYAFAPDALPGRHPLLEGAIAELGLPDDVSVGIDIASEVPAGSSTGTSAAVVVAVIAALDALTPGRMTPHEIAYSAHRIEVVRLGMQAGIQDQLCAAYGGINYIEMSSYPYASVSQLAVPHAVRWELERRLVLVYLGRAHVSSDVHDQVISALDGRGESSPELERLRRCAQDARDAVHACDLPALGRAMISNTEAQRDLHPDLVGRDARTVIDIARANGALGWKVNGAGGEGGSMTLLCSPDRRVKHQLLSAVREASSQFLVIPIRLSRHGVRVW